MQTATRTVAAGLIMGFALAGCGSDRESPTGAPSPTAPTTSATGDGRTELAPGETRPVPGVAVQKTVATGLDVPWGVAFLADGSALVTERPTGRVLRIGKDGGTTPVGTVPGVADQGEGGLLGLAVPPWTADQSQDAATPAAPARTTVYAYFTSTAGDNRVVAMSYDGQKLGRPTPVLTGIPSAGNHNGGLVTVGPDGKLWIGTGEGGQPPRAQDRAGLGGKILRINLDGSIPDDNPFPGSPVYSLGHRNVQGLDFDSAGRPWAVEFGQNTWDELNLIVPGGNYGWPEVEGKQARKGFIEPLVQWTTDEASPSGMAIVDDVAYIGGLRGERLWQVPLAGTTTGTPKDYLEGDVGRIRNVVATPGGGLWITTSNRDGRGDPGPDDDKIIQLTLQP
jgi:glucose/arabinose dehydrogenase